MLVQTSQSCTPIMISEWSFSTFIKVQAVLYTIHDVFVNNIDVNIVYTMKGSLFDNGFVATI